MFAALTGLGEGGRKDPGDGDFDEDAFEAGAILRAVDGVLTELVVPARFSGVLA